MYVRYERRPKSAGYPSRIIYVFGKRRSACCLFRVYLGKRCLKLHRFALRTGFRAMAGSQVPQLSNVCQSARPNDANGFFVKQVVTDDSGPNCPCRYGF